jgi:hypothetical protein
MQRILDRPLNYDHDYDGRPPVGWPDPLLDALVRAHPEMIPAELVDHLATSRSRVTF